MYIVMVWRLDRPPISLNLPPRTSCSRLLQELTFPAAISGPFGVEGVYNAPPAVGHKPAEMHDSPSPASDFV